MQENKKIPRGQTPERRAYMKHYVATHPKRDRRAYKKAYDEAHKEEIAAYRIKRGQELLNKKKEYYRANRERILANVKARSIVQRDKILAYQADYYEANTDKVKERVGRYRKNNPDKKQHLENRRRASKFKNGGSHTLEQRLEKFGSLGNVCFYCKEPKPLTVDHNIPLSRGGTDNIDNILPACRSCNSKKNNLTTEEYLGKMKRRRKCR